MHLPERYCVGTRGMSFIEVLVAAAIIALVFGGLVAGFQFSLVLLSDTRSQTGALALANERIEYLRSLPYDSVGTVSGIPSGTIAQNETVILNGTSFNRRTFVQYVDSTADGFGAADSNGITADYKRAKVEVTWSQKGSSKAVRLVTNVIPRGMETVAGGGTLIANIFDASAVPIASAAVRVVNASTTPTIDVTSYTNADGQVIFPGAPAGGGYEVSVTKDGYSSAQTYSASTTNPNPNPAHVAVVEGDVSTVNFAIDRTATTTVLTVEPPSLYQQTDTFADASGIATSTSTDVVLGSLVLSGGEGAYPSTGEARGVSVAPAQLIAWNEARFALTIPVGTTALVQAYSVNASGTATLLADADVPGNGAGFSVSPIDLSAVSPTLHSEVALGVLFTTTDASTTPQLLDWEVEYEAADVPIPNVTFTIFGSKSIGTDGLGAPVLKHTSDVTTNALGSSTVGALEWDTYDISIDGSAEGYDVSDVCPRIPLSLAPATATTTTLVLTPHVSRSLRVFVQSVAGDVLTGADVRLSRSGYDVTNTTSSCGNAFFSNPSSASDYTLETTAPGYLTDTLTNVSVTDTTDITVTLVPS